MIHNLTDIKPVALQLWRELKPHCKKIKIAGSIRRGLGTVKDIEIVCLPDGRKGRNKIGMHLLSTGKIVKGQMSGRYVKAIYKGYKVDIFLPQEFDYYRILAIRTGSAAYSKRIANAWKDKGYVGTENGLQEVSKRGHMLQSPTWKSEREFFEWLGMEYLKPINRF